MWLSIVNPSVQTLFMLGLMLKLLSWDQRERLTLFIIKRFQKVRIQKKQEIKKSMGICRYRKGYYINKERLINEFIELVKVDSETKFEAKINTLLQEKFTALGLEVKEDEATKHIDHEANNLICTLPGNVEHVDPIFFTCHMDTVTPGQQIQPQIND